MRKIIPSRREASIERAVVQHIHAAHGIVGMKLTSGTGKASLSVKGRGLNLYSVPTLPLDQGTPVRVQLINDANDVCWEASYSAPASATDATKFKDKND